MKKPRYLGHVPGLALTAVLLLHVSGILPIGFLHTLENQFYDARLRQMLPEAPDTRVAIVDIDEKSLKQLGHWPWNRTVLANIVDTLFEHYRITAIGFDTVFAEADTDEGLRLLEQLATGPLKDDRAFLNEYKRAVNTTGPDARLARSLENRRSVLGFVMDTDTRTGMLPAPVARLDRSLQNRIPFIVAEGYTANLDTLQASAGSGGFFDNPLLDDDGVFRRIALLQQYDGALYEALALALTRAALGFPPLELVVAAAAGNADELMLESVNIGDIRIPVDHHAGMLVPYIGKRRSFAYLPVVDVLDKSAPVEALHGKIALLGSSAAGLHDLRTTPLQAAFPGVEIHANVIQGILDRRVMHQPGYTTAIEFLLLLTMGGILAAVLPKLPPLSGVLFCSALLLVLVAGNLFLWASYQRVLPLASPVLLVILMFALQMTYGFFVETRNKRKLTRLFGQYVPPELVDEISLNMEAINLDGEIREMTVLFADIRDFTTLSENMAPAAITGLINGFLTPVTDIIHQHRGTIDKYLGDAVMAFWGAPLDDADHARHALTAALTVIQRLNTLEAEFAAQGWPALSIGIGINSGKMNVGNKGSEFRVDYTVLGDAVNLGARLERLTRVYGVNVIAGENTRDAVPEFEFRELDRVRVKGRNKAVTIYEPLGPAASISESERSELLRFHRGLEYYRKRQWNEAEQQIAPLHQADPQRKLYRLYLDRIDRYRHNPPPDDWNGCYAHDSME